MPYMQIFKGLKNVKSNVFIRDYCWGSGIGELEFDVFISDIIPKNEKQP